METYEEDPAETYRREFIERRWEKERAAKERRERGERTAHKIARYFAFPIALFGFMLLIDKYLPPVVHHEVVETGWQERGGGRNPELYSFIQTENFIVPVPHAVHIDFPYSSPTKPEMMIAVSPIFRLPRGGAVELNNERIMFTINSIHNMFFPLSWMLVVSAMFTIIKKEFSKLTYSLCFLPMLLLAFVLLAVF